MTVKRGKRSKRLRNCGEGKITSSEGTIVQSLVTTYDCTTSSCLWSSMMRLRLERMLAEERIDENCGLCWEQGQFYILPHDALLEMSYIHLQVNSFTENSARKSKKETQRFTYSISEESKKTRKIGKVVHKGVYFNSFPEIQSL